MTELAVAWIHAFKPYQNENGSGLIACHVYDEEATVYDVHYRGAAYSSDCIRVESRLQAERICGALRRTHEIGKIDQMATVRAFLGIR